MLKIPQETHFSLPFGFFLMLNLPIGPQTTWVYLSHYGFMFRITHLATTTPWSNRFVSLSFGRRWLNVRLFRRMDVHVNFIIEEWERTVRAKYA